LNASPLSNGDRIATLKQALSDRTLLKAIAGIHNSDLTAVLAVAEAAQAGGAVAVDVKADADLICAVREAAPNLVVFASSVDPAELVVAVQAGADVVELGNYDALYAEGAFFSAQTVYQLAETCRYLLPTTPMSVTIPGHLSEAAQQALAKQLTQLGVEMLQTEGAVAQVGSEHPVTTLTPDSQFELTLRNTRVIDQVTTLPILTASSVTIDNVSRALQAGASGVGVGALIRAQLTHGDRVAVVDALQTALNEAAKASTAVA
jgi:hypothetical protein